MALMQLSEKQQKAVAAAVTVLAVFVIIAATGALVWLIADFFHTFSNVFLPLAVAAIAALVFQPYYEWLRERLRFPPVFAVTAVFLSVLLPLVAFFWFFGSELAGQVEKMADQAPTWWEETKEDFEGRLPRVRQFLEVNPVGQHLQTALEEQGEEVMGRAQSFLSGVVAASAGVLRGVAGLLGWVVLPVYFAFFLMARPGDRFDPDTVFPFLKPETRKDLGYLLREFVSIIVAFFRGQLVVAFLQGLLFAVGFTLVGLDYGFVLGLVLGFLNVIPYLGSIVGLGAALPLALFQPDGGWYKLIWVLVVFTIVQMIEGYLLTPKIMGDRTGLHPMVIIVAIFFWGSALNGILGMILAIPLTAFLVVFWRLARDKYLDEWV